MRHKWADKVAKRYLLRKVEAVSRKKNAGEVRFIKDNAGDASQWAFNNMGPSERLILKDFVFSSKKVKPLAKALRSTAASLGHVMSAYTCFAKIKSSEVSPDGNLGGKGYIQKISDMRRQYMNVVEALSALSDTLYDEIKAPHWAAISRQEPEDKKEIIDIIEDAEEIRKDPEAWATEEEQEMDLENQGTTLEVV